MCVMFDTFWKIHLFTYLPEVRLMSIKMKQQPGDTWETKIGSSANQLA